LNIGFNGFNIFKSSAPEQPGVLVSGFGEKVIPTTDFVSAVLLYAEYIAATS
jgi:hypothetical protein